MPPTIRRLDRARAVAMLALLLGLAALTACLALPPRALAAPPAPTPRGVIFNLPVTGSSTAGVFSSALASASSTIGGSAAPTSAYRVTVCVTGSNSVVSFQAIGNGATVTMSLNGGTALTAGCVYTFTVGVTGAYTNGGATSRALTYNVSVTTTTTLAYLIVDEVTDGQL